MTATLKELVAASLDHTTTAAGRVVHAITFGAIISSVTATVLETVPEIEAAHGGLFEVIEIGAVAMFSAEFLLRLWSAGAPSSGFAARRHPRLAYLFSAWGLIDLASVAPFYLGASSLVVLRSLRLLRIFRVLKLTRQARAMHLLGQAFRARRDELLSLVAVVGLALLISATVMYSAEHDAQPKNFGSVPQSLWWAVATLTTVGYGDIYPVTIIGRVCASFIMIIGIGLVALPTGLLGSAIYELLAHRVCPHCHKELVGRQMAEPLRAVDDHAHPKREEPAA